MNETPQKARTPRSTYFWKGFRKGLGQGALFGSLFFGLGTWVLLCQHRWWAAFGCLVIGCITSYLGMKVWMQEDDL